MPLVTDTAKIRITWIKRLIDLLQLFKFLCNGASDFKGPTDVSCLGLKLMEICLKSSQNETWLSISSFHLHSASSWATDQSGLFWQCWSKLRILNIAFHINSLFFPPKISRTFVCFYPLTHLILLVLLDFCRSWCSLMTHSWYSCFWISVTCFSSLAHLFSNTWSLTVNSRTEELKSDIHSVTTDWVWYIWNFRWKTYSVNSLCDLSVSSATCCASKCWEATAFTSWSDNVLPSSCITLSISVVCLSERRTSVNLIGLMENYVNTWIYYIVFD